MRDDSDVADFAFHGLAECVACLERRLVLRGTRETSSDCLTTWLSKSIDQPNLQKLDDIHQLIDWLIDWMSMSFQERFFKHFYENSQNEGLQKNHGNLALTNRSSEKQFSNNHICKIKRNRQSNNPGKASKKKFFPGEDKTRQKCYNQAIRRYSRNDLLQPREQCKTANSRTQSNRKFSKQSHQRMFCFTEILRSISNHEQARSNKNKQIIKTLQNYSFVITNPVGCLCVFNPHSALSSLKPRPVCAKYTERWAGCEFGYAAGPLRLIRQ